MKNGKCIVFSAPSGSGKTTLARHLLDQETFKLSFSISATTRPPRGKEQHGKDYYFLSEEAFNKNIAENAFAEQEEVYPGMFYGTLKSELERIWAAGKNVLFDIDVIGGLNIKKLYPNDTLAIFIKTPSLEALGERLRQRGTDSEEKIAMRLSKAETELQRAADFDHIILNDDLETAKAEVEKVVRNFLNA
ncbi:MAG: guanylate kinase [Flavobacteriaceae bacterium]